MARGRGRDLSLFVGSKTLHPGEGSDVIRIGRSLGKVLPNDGSRQASIQRNGRDLVWGCVIPACGQRGALVVAVDDENGVFDLVDIPVVLDGQLNSLFIGQGVGCGNGESYRRIDDLALDVRIRASPIPREV